MLWESKGGKIDLIVTPAQRINFDHSHAPQKIPWTGKSCFSNRALVKAIFEAPKCL